MCKCAITFSDVHIIKSAITSATFTYFMIFFLLLMGLIAVGEMTPSPVLLHTLCPQNTPRCQLSIGRTQQESKMSWAERKCSNVWVFCEYWWLGLNKYSCICRWYLSFYINRYKYTLTKSSKFLRQKCCAWTHSSHIIFWLMRLPPKTQITTAQRVTTENSL